MKRNDQYKMPNFDLYDLDCIGFSKLNYDTLFYYRCKKHLYFKLGCVKCLIDKINNKEYYGKIKLL